MNKDEKRAQNFLLKYYSNVQYEPVKNSPPDFLIDNEIAVEVRRLNQNYFGDSEIKGLEELDIPLHWSILEVLETFQNRYEGITYAVILDFQRPLNSSIHNIKEELSRKLEDFLNNDLPLPHKMIIDKNIGIEIIRKPKPLENELFHLGMSIDNDTGGAVGSIFFENIDFCISEKSTKIEKYKKTYDEWWLILVNHIYFLALENQLRVDSLKKDLRLRNFDKLLVIHPEKLEVSFSMS